MSPAIFVAESKENQMDYGDRALSDVSIWAFSLNKFPDTFVASSTVSFRLTDREGGNDGPEVRVELAVPVNSSDPSFRDVERALLEGAVAILRRLAAERPEAIYARFEEPQREENLYAKQP
jgi:hypothetical protein